VVAFFAILFTRGQGIIRLLNPVIRRVLASPLAIATGPNALLIVRGRRSGRPRTFPVSFVERDRGGLLQAAAPDVAWVQNLRSAGSAVIVRGRARHRFMATELTPDAAGRRIPELLAAFPRSRLVRAAAGPLASPPVAILLYFRLRLEDRLEEYVATARRQPVFELRRE
jgi:deazaflavin-dependent oxidoreductase (nitroreductase family)